MAENSKIEWTDHTFNPWIGCTKVGPGCDACYAEAMMDHRYGRVRWGAGQPRQRTSYANWRKPVAWNRAADGGPRQRVFCASLADVFDNEVPLEWLVYLFDLIRCTPNLDWLLLTKRIGRVRAALDCAIADVNVYQGGEELFRWLRDWRAGAPPMNVWLGATIVNQPEAERDIAKLLQVPARVRFLSIEPMLGPIDLTRLLMSAVDWVIAGGESGPKARPAHPDWFRWLRDQCAAAGVPFLFKQWGEWRPPAAGERYNTINGTTGSPPAFLIDPTGNVHCTHEAAGEGATAVIRVGKKRAGRLLDGRTWDQFPVALEGEKACPR